MKKVISILILMLLIFFIFQWGFVFFKKGHEISYQVSVDNTIFKIEETYHKEKEDAYDILIENGEDRYSYFLSNQYNKQKKIIVKIEYYQEENYHCIYPILNNQEGTYLQCIMDNRLYTDISFPNQVFIEKVKSDLFQKGYILRKDLSDNSSNIIGGSTVYMNHLLPRDTITLWNYKGIEIIKPDNFDIRNVLNFDKYQNNHGFLVGKYYVIPNYLSSKVLEFNSVEIVNVETSKADTIELDYTLSAESYVNGIIDDKIYFTDPNNLLQIEIHPVKRNARLIGSKELGGQVYHGGWESVSIYDFTKEHIEFHEEIPKEITDRYSYSQLLEGGSGYYFIQNSGVYRISKNHLDIPVLLFEKNGLNNIKVVDNTIYFVVDDILYYYEDEVGVVSVLKNNELRYNILNRIDVYRKS